MLARRQRPRKGDLMPVEGPSPMFLCGGYDIGDERLTSHREVSIHCSHGPIPALGDPFTIVRGGALHDLVVLAVLRSGPDWTARCGVVGAA